MFIGFDERCIRLDSTGTCVFVTELECNHEEADTRMLLHAHHASQSTENIVIHTPDTDVLLIAIAASSQISGNIFIRTGTKNKVRIISIEKVKNTLILRYDLQPTITELLSKSLLGFHAFTGCDTVSAFSNKGKVKPLKILLKNQKYMETFAEIGNNPAPSDEQLDKIQEFV